MHNLEGKLSNKHRCPSVCVRGATKIKTLLILCYFHPTKRTTVPSLRDTKDPQPFYLAQHPRLCSERIRPNNPSTAPAQVYKKHVLHYIRWAFINGTPLHLFIIHLVKENSLVAFLSNQIPHYVPAVTESPRSINSTDVLMQGPWTVWLWLCSAIYKASKIRRVNFLFFFYKNDQWSLPPPLSSWTTADKT